MASAYPDERDGAGDARGESGAREDPPAAAAPAGAGGEGDRHEDEERRVELREKRESPEDPEDKGRAASGRIREPCEGPEREDDEEGDEEVRVDDAGVREEVRLQRAEGEGAEARESSEAAAGFGADGKKEKDEDADEREPRPEQDRLGGRVVFEKEPDESPRVRGFRERVVGRAEIRPGQGEPCDGFRERRDLGVPAAGSLADDFDGAREVGGLVRGGRVAREVVDGEGRGERDESGRDPRLGAREDEPPVGRGDRGGAGSCLGAQISVNTNRLRTWMRWEACSGSMSQMRSGDRRQQGVAVLRREAEADDLLALVGDGERRRRDDRLREDPAVIAVVTAEREHLVRGLALREGDERVRLEPLENRLLVGRLRELEVEPHGVHVLRVELDRRREDLRLEAERLVEMEDVARVVRPELLVVVLPDGRRGRIVLRLGDVVRAAHADELRAVHRERRRRHPSRGS